MRDTNDVAFGPSKFIGLPNLRAPHGRRDQKNSDQLCSWPVLWRDPSQVRSGLVEIYADKDFARSAISLHAIPSPDAAMSTALQPRARGLARLRTKAHGPRSVIDDLRQQGSLKLVFPRPRSAALDAVVVNTAGGITGGDVFSLALEAAPETHLRVTTQAAERAYRSQPTERGRLATTLHLGARARLDWVPQETLLFDGCALDRRLVVEMADDARFLMVEPLVFGRAAMAETLRTASFRDRVDIRRAGRLVFADRIQLHGDVTAHLSRPGVSDGAGAMVSLLYCAPDADLWLPILRAALPETAGASLVREGILFVRGLAVDSHALRCWLVPLLDRLTDGDLPRPWMI